MLGPAVRRLRKHIIGMGLLLGCVTALPAYAQQSVQLPTAQTMANDFPVCTKKATEVEQEQARQKFIAARQDSDEGQYDTAIKRFKIAYDLDCSKPELLLMIATAFEKKGDLTSKQAAVAALEVYTQRAPKDAPDMATTLTKIDNMKKALSTTPPPSASNGNGASKPEEPHEHSVVPWIVVGVGGAALVTGLVLSFIPYPDGCSTDNQANGKPGTCTGPNADANLSTAGTVHGLHIGGPITAAVGGAMIVGGLVWHFLEPTGTKSSSTGVRRNFSPTIAPGFGGLSYGGTF